MDSKKWYLSKGIWAGVATTLLSMYDAAAVGLASGCADIPVGLCFHLPLVPTWVIGGLALVGIHARATAKTTLTK